jgi:hypothetical protein
VFEIAAEIEGGFDDPDVVCAFDPNKVILRLRRLFPGLEVDAQDYAWRDFELFARHAWRDFELFARHGLVDESGALGVAARDARRRGPVWLFRLPSESGAVRGKAERHFVSFFSESPFAEPLRSQLIAFVEGLRFASCVGVKCVRIEGNDEHPA